MRGGADGRRVGLGRDGKAKGAGGAIAEGAWCGRSRSLRRVRYKSHVMSGRMVG